MLQFDSRSRYRGNKGGRRLQKGEWISCELFVIPTHDEGTTVSLGLLWYNRNADRVLMMIMNICIVINTIIIIATIIKVVVVVVVVVIVVVIIMIIMYKKEMVNTFSHIRSSLPPFRKNKRNSGIVCFPLFFVPSTSYEWTLSRMEREATSVYELDPAFRNSVLFVELQTLNILFLVINVYFLS